MRVKENLHGLVILYSQILAVNVPQFMQRLHTFSNLAAAVHILQPMDTKLNHQRLDLSVIIMLQVVDLPVIIVHQVVYTQSNLSNMLSNFFLVFILCGVYKFHLAMQTQYLFQNYYCGCTSSATNVWTVHVCV